MAILIQQADAYMQEMVQYLGKNLSFDMVVTTKQVEGSPLTVCIQGRNAHICYDRRVELFRGISLAAQHAQDNGYYTEQVPRFSMNGAMLDCSRNGVMHMDAAKQYIRMMASMGLDMLMLYTEDTYEVPGYPYFGYMRGRYSQAELKTLDEYAAGYGIELIPCIQTLAHLQGALRWPCFEKITDCEDILLCEEEETYRLIEAMLSSCRQCFQSKRIHIGMDEAFMLALGNYRVKHGYQVREEVFCRHLQRVVNICRQYDFKPMIWSDMLFRMAFGGDYYVGGDIAKEVIDMFPQDVQLVYWEYGTEEKNIYLNQIQRHKKFELPIVFAGGAWVWSGFTPALEQSLIASRAALAACKEQNIREVIMTVWGDNGHEGAFFASLPVLQLYAELSYCGDISNEELSARLKTCTGESLEKMLLLDLPNRPDGKMREPHRNPSKYLYYQDVLGGLMERHVEMSYADVYRSYTPRLMAAAGEGGPFAYLYEQAAALSHLLEIKSTVGVRMRQAYMDDDRETLTWLARQELPELLKRMEVFHLSVEKQWMTECKVYGYEVLDIRMSGVEGRVKTAIRRLEAYLTGMEADLPDLKEEKLFFDCREDEQASKIMSYNWWRPLVSASDIGR